MTVRSRTHVSTESLELDPSPASRRNAGSLSDVHRDGADSDVVRAWFVLNNSRTTSCRPGPEAWAP